MCSNQRKYLRADILFLSDIFSASVIRTADSWMWDLVINVTFWVFDCNLWLSSKDTLSVCMCVYPWVRLCTEKAFLKATEKLLEVISLKDPEGVLTLCSLVFKKMNAELQYFILFVSLPVLGLNAALCLSSFCFAALSWFLLVCTVN